MQALDTGLEIGGSPLLQVNPSNKTPQSEKGDALKEGGVRWNCEFAGSIGFQCRRECLMHAEVLRPLGRVANCFREAATHALEPRNC